MLRLQREWTKTFQGLDDWAMPPRFGQPVSRSAVGAQGEAAPQVVGKAEKKDRSPVQTMGGAERPQMRHIGAGRFADIL